MSLDQLHSMVLEEEKRAITDTAERALIKEAKKHLKVSIAHLREACDQITTMLNADKKDKRVKICGYVHYENPRLDALILIKYPQKQDFYLVSTCNLTHLRAKGGPGTISIDMFKALILNRLSDMDHNNPGEPYTYRKLSEFYGYVQINN